MDIILRRLGVLLVCILFLGGADDPDKVTRTMKKVKSSIFQLEGVLTSQKETASQHQHTVAKIETDIHKNSAELSKIKSQLRGKHQHITLIAQNIQTLKSHHAQQQLYLEQQLFNKYRTYKTERWKLIFNQPPRHEQAKLTVYYDYFDQARVAHIRELLSKLRFLFAQERLLAEESSVLAQLKINHDQKVNLLRSTQAEHAKELTKLHQEMHKNKTQLSALKQQEKELESLFKQLQKNVRSLQKFSPIKGASQFPKMLGKLHPPLKISPLNFTPGKYLFFPAREGTDVFSVFPGRVVFSQWLKGMGLLLIIDHGAGYMSVYGNNQVLYKAAGDVVQAGDPVSKVGISGGRKDPGLYFEIRKDGKPLDAHRWFLQG